MPRIDLLRTTTFRLAAFYLGLFTLSVMAVLAVVYWFTAGFIERHTEETILREVNELRNTWENRGRVGLMQLVSERSENPRTEMIYAVATPNLDVIAGNLATWPMSTGQVGWTAFDIRSLRKPGPVRPAVAVVISLGSSGWLLVGHDMTERYLLRGQILTGLVWAVLLAVCIGTAGALLMGRRVAVRIETVNRTIDRITAGHFADRMPIAGTGDEIDRLSQNLNRMLDEIGRLMLSMRQVTDNVAHDLRTPLSRLRARLELALLEEEMTSPQRATLEMAIGEIDRLLGVFGALLTIAAAESGRARTDFAAVDLGALVADAAELYEPVAEERGQSLSVSGPSGIQVQGSRQLLAQLLSNLVENAVKYTPEGGTVSIAAAQRPDGAACLSVADTGPGIPAGDRERVLDRFVRLEEHRGTPGHGLGLSLVAAVARLHDASLSLEDNGPGLRVVVVFPRAVELRPSGRAALPAPGPRPGLKPPQPTSAGR
ncbi:sensor histidine kinase [Oleisolibacter albus]|uniref:sensor histidine kinase n=1 Tax=Oleisolibacter albus TaxID=2171757 RepID=UPI001EFE4647|nr:HAMP domain-containing sensor histidine kinase [Oleisolibacter albus]